VPWPTLFNSVFSVFSGQNHLFCGAHPEVAGAVDVAIFLLRGSWVTSRWSFKPWLMSICAG
jgi:hypothetical protein